MFNNLIFKLIISAHYLSVTSLKDWVNDKANSGQLLLVIQSRIKGVIFELMATYILESDASLAGSAIICDLYLALSVDSALELIFLQLFQENSELGLVLCGLSELLAAESSF